MRVRCVQNAAKRTYRHLVFQKFSEENPRTLAKRGGKEKSRLKQEQAERRGHMTGAKVQRLQVGKVGEGGGRESEVWGRIDEMGSGGLGGGGIASAVQGG